MFISQSAVLLLYIANFRCIVGENRGLVLH